VTRIVLFALIVGSLGAAAARAQTAPDRNTQAGTTSSEAERARIRAERSVIESAFVEEERVCYQKFAVNDCIGRARVARRDAVADLRRQELAINAAEARRRGAEQITRTEEKMSPQAMREAEKRLLDAQASQEARLKSIDERALEREKAAEQAPQRSKELQDRIDARDRAQKERDAKAQEQAENRRIFELKQEEARKRRPAQPDSVR
jgi:colicin import membrane protein